MPINEIIPKTASDGSASIAPTIARGKEKDNHQRINPALKSKISTNKMHTTDRPRVVTKLPNISPLRAESPPKLQRRTAFASATTGQ